MKHLTEDDVSSWWNALMPPTGQAPLGGWFWKHYPPSIQRRIVDFAETILVRYGITETQARERERKAYFTGARDQFPPFATPHDSISVLLLCDVKYPPLVEQGRMFEAFGPSGAHYRCAVGGLVEQEIKSMLNGESTWQVETFVRLDDVATVADLMRRESEESARDA